MTGSMNRRDVLRIGASLAAIPAARPQVPKAAAWAPAFFNSHQNDTITSFGDILIPATDTPGAKDALVNRYLDKLLAASDHAWQNEFAQDLDVLDRFSRQRAGADFVRITPDQQRTVLEKMVVSSERPAFDRLKGWTARVYYATKAGFDELNKGGRVPGSFGCLG